MADDHTRQADALFRTLERDEEQYIKGARAVHDGKMAPDEMRLLWRQFADAHDAWSAFFDHQENAHG